LTLVLFETSDEEKDSEKLNQIFSLLKEFRGKDEVYLRVVNDEKITNLRLTNTYVDYSPDLQKKLSKLISIENQLVEEIIKT
jgi:hypothetical protein